MPRYIYGSANEWLEKAFKDGSIGEDDLLALILNIVDNDAIQDEFQDEMDDDGFFVDLDNDDEVRQFIAERHPQDIPDAFIGAIGRERFEALSREESEVDDA